MHTVTKESEFHKYGYSSKRLTCKFICRNSSRTFRRSLSQPANYELMESR